MRRRNPYPGAVAYRDRHGKPRVRFRMKGRAACELPAPIGSRAFVEAYEKALAGKIEIGAERTKPYSISALCARYYATAKYKRLADSSKATRRGIVERFRAKHGDKDVRKLKPKHIDAIIDSMSETPAAANNLLRVLRLLLDLAIKEEWRKDNPARLTDAISYHTDGFHTWTEEEIAQFEAHWPIGSTPRLALALLLYTGQRRSDGVTMGWQHVTAEGRISVRQLKTKKRLKLKIHPALADVLNDVPRKNLTFLLNRYGRPFSTAGFGNAMRDWCDAAGLPHCAAHGLRKAAARRLADAGNSGNAIMAVTGHQTLKEVTRYTAAADQARLADGAINTMPGRSDREHGASNPIERFDKHAAKRLQTKEK